MVQIVEKRFKFGEDGSRISRINSRQVERLQDLSTLRRDYLDLLQYRFSLNKVVIDRRPCV